MKNYNTEEYEARTERRIRLQVESSSLRKKQLAHVDNYFNQLEDIKSGRDQGKACKVCGVKKPITEFHVDLTYKNARRSECKSCHKNRQNRRPRRTTKKRKLAQLELTVRNDIEDKLGYRTLASSFELWNILGYDKEDLAKHLESQFEDWMNWENNGRAPKGCERKMTWQLDHIIPRGCFPYENLNEENFKECWALKNLRPIDSVDNLFLGLEYKNTKEKIR
tara:strand:+ start:688 stop:1353 length:666 start_codon:yes stop_codon:yes gene_type:complete